MYDANTNAIVTEWKLKRHKVFLYYFIVKILEVYWFTFWDKYNYKYPWVV